MVRIEVQYTGDLHCDASHEPSAAVLSTDAPVDNNGKGESFSPTDLVAAALGTCMLTVMGIAAEKRGIDLGLASASVDKEMSQDLPRRIVRLTVRIKVPLPAEHPQREVLEAAALSCPVYHSVHADLEKVVSFAWDA
ncbi:MAG: OsmC family protein [Verrucomicrobiales bacterium]